MTNVYKETALKEFENQLFQKTHFLKCHWYSERGVLGRIRSRRMVPPWYHVEKGETEKE